MASVRVCHPGESAGLTAECFVNYREKSAWRARLRLFPTVRIHLHLPKKGFDRDRNWRRFKGVEHQLVVSEIESYLRDRLQGLSYEVHSKKSGGIWRGDQEKKSCPLFGSRGPDYGH